MNLLTVGFVQRTGREFFWLLIIFYGLSFLVENSHWEHAKQNCIHPYNCASCGQNCLRGKRVVLNFGSNDLLKREILPDFPFPPGRNAINLRWSKAFNIVLQKLRYSGVQEVIILDVPEFPFIDMPEAERYVFLPSTDYTGLYFL